MKNPPLHSLCYLVTLANERAYEMKRRILHCHMHPLNVVLWFPLDFEIHWTPYYTDNARRLMNTYPGIPFPDIMTLTLPILAFLALICTVDTCLRMSEFALIPFL